MKSVKLTFLGIALLLGSAAQGINFLTSSSYDDQALTGELQVVCFGMHIHSKTIFGGTCNYMHQDSDGNPEVWSRGAIIDLAAEVSEVCRDGLSLEVTADDVNLVTSGVNGCNVGTEGGTKFDLNTAIEWDSSKKSMNWKAGYGTGT